MLASTASCARTPGGVFGCSTLAQLVAAALGFTPWRSSQYRVLPLTQVYVCACPSALGRGKRSAGLPRCQPWRIDSASSSKPSSSTGGPRPTVSTTCITGTSTSSYAGPSVPFCVHCS